MDDERVHQSTVVSTTSGHAQTVVSWRDLAPAETETAAEGASSVDEQQQPEESNHRRGRPKRKGAIREGYLASS